MTDSHFQAAMTEDEMLDGEARHAEIEQSRRLAMTAGLIKSSDELRGVWDSDSDTYQTLLNGAVAAYEQNILVEELLRSAIGRLVSVVDEDQVERGLFQRCAEIAACECHTRNGYNH